MSILLCITMIGLVLYFEWDLVFTALTPLVDIAVAIFFIIMLTGVIVAEAALIVIAPVALIFGHESREWHGKVARKLMFVSGRDENAKSK